MGIAWRSLRQTRIRWLSKDTGSECRSCRFENSCALRIDHDYETYASDVSSGFKNAWFNGGLGSVYRLHLTIRTRKWWRLMVLPLRSAHSFHQRICVRSQFGKFEKGLMKAEVGRVTPLDIDQLDRKILRLLKDDGRRPNAEIARAVGVSVPTVRRRLERLQESGVLRIIGLLNPVATGFPVDVFLALTIRDGFALSVGRRLAAMNCVAFVGHTTGRFDMLVEAFFSNLDALFDFCAEALDSSGGVISAETYFILGVDKFNYMWDLPDESDVPPGTAGAMSMGTPGVTQSNPAPPRLTGRRKETSVERSENEELWGEGNGRGGLDTLDRQILRLLRDDGRRPNAEIARAVGVSEPTARKRIERLQQSGVLRIIGLLDPAATGFPVYAMMLIEVEPSAAREIGAQLAAMERVANVSYITGRAHVWCEAMLPTNKALHSFLCEELASVPGIIRTEAFQVLAIDKFSYMWDLPESQE